MMSTIDADEAWWPPTLTPLEFGRPRLAASTIAAETQSTRCAIERSTCSSLCVITADILPSDRPRRPYPTQARRTTRPLCSRFIRSVRSSRVIGAPSATARTCQPAASASRTDSINGRPSSAWASRSPSFSGTLRCPRKNVSSSSADSADSTSETTSGRWLSRRSRTTSHRLPTAPAFSSQAPKTIRSTRLSTAAPAHIVHGSRVTTRVCPSRRHSPRARAASRSATTSACPVGSCSASRTLRPRPTVVPSGPTTTAPMGTSPVASADRASSRAACMAASQVCLVTLWSRGGQADRVVEELAEAEPARDVREHLVGVEVEVVEQHAHVHGVHAEVAEQVEVAGRGLVVLVLRRRQAQEADGGAGQLPLVGGGDVGEQDPGARAGHAHDDEEVLIHRHQADGTAVTGEAAQRVGEPVDVLDDVVGELLDGPHTLVAVGGQGEVDAIDLF